MTRHCLSPFSTPCSIALSALSCFRGIIPPSLGSFPMLIFPVIFFFFFFPLRAVQCGAVHEARVCQGRHADAAVEGAGACAVGQGAGQRDADSGVRTAFFFGLLAHSLTDPRPFSFSTLFLLRYENYNKFISATETIRQMRQQVNGIDDGIKTLNEGRKPRGNKKKEKGSCLPFLLLGMAKISELSTKIDSHLAGNRQRIETLTSSHMSVSSFVFLIFLVFLGRSPAVTCPSHPSSFSLTSDFPSSLPAPSSHPFFPSCRGAGC